MEVVIDVDDLPPPRTAEALWTVFSIARTMAGSLVGEEQAELLEWLDAVQGVKQRRKDQSIREASEMEVRIEQARQEALLARKRRDEAEAQETLDKYRRRAERDMARTARAAERAAERRKARQPCPLCGTPGHAVPECPFRVEDGKPIGEVLLGKSPRPG